MEDIRSSRPEARLRSDIPHGGSKGLTKVSGYSSLARNVHIGKSV